MRLTILIFLCLFLIFGCAKKKNSGTPDGDWRTSSIVPVDTETEDFSPETQSIASSYVQMSYQAGSSHYDEYGYLLPTTGSGFGGQGDALMWNSVSLATMCMFKNYDLSTEITALWNTLKTNSVLPDGGWIRHPDYKKDASNSISKDLMLGFMYLGAVAYQYDCEPIKSEMLPILTAFRDYGSANSWEMGVEGWTNPTTTVLKDRTRLNAVLHLYGEKVSALDLSTSISSLDYSTLWADYIFYHNTECKKGNQISCALAVKKGAEYTNHLTYLSLMVYWIEMLNYEDAYFSRELLVTYFRRMAKIGENIDASNWLYVAAFRKFTMENPTYKDVHKALSKWPKTLPGEVKGSPWGCTDFTWQRTPGEKCTGDTNVEYIGTDYLNAYVFTQ